MFTIFFSYIIKNKFCKHPTRTYFVVCEHRPKYATTIITTMTTDILPSTIIIPILRMPTTFVIRIICTYLFEPLSPNPYRFCANSEQTGRPRSRVLDIRLSVQLFPAAGRRFIRARFANRRRAADRSIN